MKTQFIDFEGIYGSGKSACALHLYETLSQNEQAEIYLENLENLDENPCDIRRCAVLNSEEFESIIRDYPFEEKMLKEKVRVYNGWNCIFMPDFRKKTSLYGDLRRYVAHNGQIPPKRFAEALLGKVEAFVNKALEDRKIYIFENMIFHQILDELMYGMVCEEEQMIKYTAEMAAALAPLNPTMFYLCTDDVKTQIDKVASERMSEDYALYPNWMDWMILNLQETKYGQAKNIKTRMDFIGLVYERIGIEEKCFEKIGFSNKHRVMIDQMDYQTENEYIAQKCME